MRGIDNSLFTATVTLNATSLRFDRPPLSLSLSFSPTFFLIFLFSFPFSHFLSLQLRPIVYGLSS